MTRQQDISVEVGTTDTHQRRWWRDPSTAPFRPAKRSHSTESDLAHDSVTVVTESFAGNDWRDVIRDLLAAGLRPPSVQQAAASICALAREWLPPDQARKLEHSLADHGAETRAGPHREEAAERHQGAGLSDDSIGASIHAAARPISMGLMVAVSQPMREVFREARSAAKHTFPVLLCRQRLGPDPPGCLRQDHWALPDPAREGTCRGADLSHPAGTQGSVGAWPSPASPLSLASATCVPSAWERCRSRYAASR